ncbi:MAG: hypothetical protein ACJAVI_003721 [Candidatus Azotimanducaceae bacterium]|jgi:hypothetical protein
MKYKARDSFAGINSVISAVMIPKASKVALSGVGKFFILGAICFIYADRDDSPENLVNGEADPLLLA